MAFAKLIAETEVMVNTKTEFHISETKVYDSYFFRDILHRVYLTTCDSESLAFITLKGTVDITIDDKVLTFEPLIDRSNRVNWMEYPVANCSITIAYTTIEISEK